MKQIKVQLYETTNLNDDPEYKNYSTSNPDSTSEEEKSQIGPRKGMRLSEKKKLDRKKQKEEKALFKSQEEFLKKQRERVKNADCKSIYKEQKQGVNDIYGILPKNICLNLQKCPSHELCGKRYRIHPIWAIQLKLCTFHLQGNCTKAEKCHWKHKEWEDILNHKLVTEKSSLDHFTGQSMLDILESRSKKAQIQEDDIDAHEILHDQRHQEPEKAKQVRVEPKVSKEFDPEDLEAMDEVKTQL